MLCPIVRIFQSLCLYTPNLNLLTFSSHWLLLVFHTHTLYSPQVLVISPQSVDDDILTLLADSKVRHLHLLQNQYTPAACRIAACTAKAWRTVKRDNPALCVHLRIESAPAAGADAAATAEVVVQPEAPVVSIVYRTPKTRVSADARVCICM